MVSYLPSRRVMTLKISLCRDEVMVAGTLNSSQDGLVVMGGAFLHASQPDTATVQKSCRLSRIKPQNVCAGNVFPTLNTRYEDAAIKDYITLRHFPKGCWLYIYESE